MHIVSILFFLALGALVVTGFKQAFQPLTKYLANTYMQSRKASCYRSV